MSAQTNTVPVVSVTPFSAQVSPRHVADAFWEMDAAQMVEFFAHLDAIAGHKLCLQMTHVLCEMAEKPGAMSTAAQVAFGTMFEHAIARAERLANWRAFKAELEIGRMVKGVKA